MAIEKVKEYFVQFGIVDWVQEFDKQADIQVQIGVDKKTFYNNRNTWLFFTSI